MEDRLVFIFWELFTLSLEQFKTSLS